MVMVCQKVTALSVNMVNTAGEAIIPPKLEKKLFLSLFVGAFCLINHQIFSIVTAAFGLFKQELFSSQICHDRIIDFEAHIHDRRAQHMLRVVDGNIVYDVYRSEGTCG